MKMKKIAALGLAAAMTISLAACGGSDKPAETTAAAAETTAAAAAETTAAAAEETTAAAAAEAGEDGPAVTSTDAINIIWSHNAPEESAGHQVALKFKEEIEARSNMTVTIYPNGQLGTVPENDQAMRDGTIQMLSGTVGGTTDMKLGYMDAPNLVTSDEQALEIFGRGTELRALTEELMNANGMKILSLMPAGFRELSSNVEVRSYDDLKGLNIRVMENPVMMAYWTDWGCNATPVAFSELYIALQQGLVDAQENTYDTITSAKLYEQQKYIINTNHVVMWSGMYMNLDFYNSLPADYQALIDWVSENIIDSYAYEINATANEAALQKMIDAGCEVIDLPEEDLVKMRENATSAYQLIRESVGDEIMDKVMAAVEAAQ